MLKRNLLMSLLGLSALLAACATTTSVSTWKAPDLSVRAGNVLVIGMTANEERRRMFENRISRELRKKGVAATPSLELVDAQEQLDRDLLRSRIATTNIDAVVVTRLVDVETRSTYVPPTTYRNFYHYYYDSRAVAYRPGYEIENEIVSLETNLYDVESEDLVWSMRSETFNPVNLPKVVEELSELIVREMSRSGVI